ncbi:hypothetical protein [Euzebya tangerina]|uniref:hypothetical protein n=1 Tax=Euzebya tangerina TaxID=591198 RepID=UPI000E3170AE|nr:hypothetical protein [Euzebya tangerina]
MAVHLDADLHVEVGGVHAHLRSEGDTLVLHTDDPAALLPHLRDLVRATGAGRASVAGVLGPTDIRLDGPTGPVASAQLTDGFFGVGHVRVHHPSQLLTSQARRTLTLTAMIGALLGLVWALRSARGTSR